jgi:hypothetical protein
MNSLCSLSPIVLNLGFRLQCVVRTSKLRCLKGTSAYFDSEYHYLSPLAGAAFSQMHILQNLYDASLVRTLT